MSSALGREVDDAVAQVSDADHHVKTALRRLRDNALDIAMRHVTIARGRLYMATRVVGLEGEEPRLVDILEKDVENNRRRADGFARSIDRIKAWKRRETNRARMAEELLREGERLLRNDPTMQRWRVKAGAHLDRYRGPYTLRAPDLPTLHLAIEGLGQVLTAERALVWLNTSNEQLDNQRPCDVWDRGDRARVIGAIETLQRAVRSA